MKGIRGGIAEGAGALPLGARLPLCLFVFGLVVALALSFAVPLASPPAYANMYSTSDAAAAVEDPESSQVDNDVGSGEAATGEDLESEEIGDEDVPMVSGLGGAEPVTNVSSRFQWIIIGGIAVVVVFFVVAVARLNLNISKMKDRFS